MIRSRRGRDRQEEENDGRGEVGGIELHRTTKKKNLKKREEYKPLEGNAFIHPPPGSQKKFACFGTASACMWDRGRRRRISIPLIQFDRKMRCVPVGLRSTKASGDDMKSAPRKGNGIHPCLFHYLGGTLLVEHGGAFVDKIDHKSLPTAYSVPSKRHCQFFPNEESVEIGCRRRLSLRVTATEAERAAIIVLAELITRSKRQGSPADEKGPFPVVMLPTFRDFRPRISTESCCGYLPHHARHLFSGRRQNQLRNIFQILF